MPSRILDEMVAGSFVPITSPALLAELRGVLSYRKLRGVIPDPSEFVALIEATSAVVEPSIRSRAARDEADNRVLEAAIAAGADFVVTGDRDLLALEAVEGTRVVSPRTFLDVLKDTS